MGDLSTFAQPDRHYIRHLAMIEIRTIYEDAQPLDDFFSRANFFGSDAWRRCQGSHCIRYGIFNKGQLVGTFLLYQYTRLGKKIVINPPMAPHCGLKLLLKGEKTFTRQSEVKRVVTAMAAFLKQEFKGALIDIALPESVADVQPFQWKKFYTTPKYSYLLNINKTDESLLGQMSTERRKNIKDAAKRGYEVRLNPRLDEVLHLVEATLKQAGAPFHRDLLAAVMADMPDEVFAVAVYKDAKAIATAVCAHDDRRAYYIAGGHDAAANDALAGTFALWQAITEAQHIGCVTFDFLGSSVPPIEKYFRGFGAELTCQFRVHSEPGLIGWLQKKRQKFKKLQKK